MTNKTQLLEKLDHNFILEIIKTTAWPIVTLIIVAIFYSQIKSILIRITNFKINAPLVNLEVDSPSINEYKEKERKEPFLSEHEKSPPIEEPKKKEDSEDWIVRLIKISKDNNSAIEEAERIYKDYESQEKNPDDLMASKSFYLYYLYSSLNKKSALLELEENYKNAKNMQQEAIALRWYCGALMITKQHKKAENLLKIYLEKDNSEENSRSIALELIDLYIDDNNISKAKDISLKYLLEYKEPESLSALYKRLSAIEKNIGNNEEASLFLDKALEYCPQDETLLFDAAYQASNNQFDSLAIVNYSILLCLSKSNQAALNNLGVSLGNLNLKLKSVDFYKDSSNLNYSLSMANMGNILLNNGFHEEAEKLADKAIAAGNVHPNIYDLSKEIHKKRDEEEKKYKDVLQKGASFQKKVRSYIERSIKPSDKVIEKSNWIVGDNLIKSFKKENNSYIIRWETAIENSTSIYMHSITVDINNQSIKGFYFRYNHPQKETILGNNNEFHNIYGYYDEEREELIIFNKDDKKEFNITLKRTSLLECM
ncbi:tetratricopeptide repeat protein [Pectobacterium brasiliense]|uniref:tetratricopeptide repeat protein n=1 Tax=Pectobacterium brasiliense TaxID=180957 RepID=UPI00057FC013|nr:hypothetical protein [Pectobacterium brasiliense]KHS69452.1 hypothetical protein QT13_11525 [Pectobacterium brasiliense]MDY4368159.1 hypothetical protein [Pectobacterium brasiliense]MDY4383882.1 hypothetical protein [Pectobacterium brasiliense]MDY7057691.1 hypothetical protein [Pectobacterium brasiliense]